MVKDRYHLGSSRNPATNKSLAKPRPPPPECKVETGLLGVCGCDSKAMAVMEEDSRRLWEGRGQRPQGMRRCSLTTQGWLQAGAAPDCGPGSCQGRRVAVGLRGQGWGQEDPWTQGLFESHASELPTLQAHKLASTSYF